MPTRSHSRSPGGPRLRLEHLEDRVTPATFGEVASTLFLDLAAAESVGVVANATTYTLTLGGAATWTGTDSANVTGNGTGILTVTAAGIAAYSDIFVDDSGAGAAVAFNNSGANTYTEAISVTLNNGSAGVSFTGTSAFGANSLTVATDAAVSLIGGAAVSTTGNPVTFTAGTFIALDGSITAPGSTVRLTATTQAIVDQNGAANNVTAANLIASAATGVGPGNALETAVANLEAAGGAGNVRVDNTGFLTIGGIGAVVGVSSTGGLVAVSATTNLFVTEAVSVGVTNTVLLVADSDADGAGDVVTIAAGTVASNGGAIDLRGADIDLGGTVNATATGVVTVNTVQTGQAIDLGTDLIGFGFTNADVGLVTAGTLRIGDATSGAIAITALISVGLAPTLSLISGDTITDTGAGTISAGSLRLSGADGVTLDNPNNSVSTALAGSVGVGGNFAFTDFNAMPVGTVDGVTGITAANGNVSLTTNSGAIFANALITASGTVTLTADASIIDGNAAANNVSAPTLIASAGGNIDLDTAVAAITATTTAAGAITIDELDGVTLTSVTAANGPITITAGGALTVNTVVSASGTVTLTAVASIVDGNGAANNVSAPTLIASAAGSGIDLDTAVGNVSFTSSGTAVNIRNTGALTINATSSSGGTTAVTATSPLTVAANVTSSGTVTLAAGDTAGTGDDLTVNAGVTVQSTGGSVTLNAGDRLVIDPTAVVSAPAGSIALAVDVNDADPGVGVTVTLAGTLTAAGGITLTGGADADTFIVTPTSPAGATINGGAGVDTIDHSAFATQVAVNLGLGTSGLSATLDGGQENPGNGQPGTGTATFSNYNAVTKTFDISVTVTNLNPALVTGYHIHRAGVGLNGPIIIPLDTLFGLGALVPSGTGFTFTATGVSLAASLLGGVANEAAFLGGQTYLNFHTAAFPGGAIRGQIFSNANLNLAAGTATGTGGISNIENAIGGSAADSLIGSFAANTLTGLGGNDTILGGPGADTFTGGADNDVMIWSNGDGSDVMDGEAGADTVAVNGSLTANDVFTVGANGTRVAFARVSPGPFTLNIGTVETLTVNGIVGDDSFTLNSLAGVADLTAVGLNGLAGNDTFAVTPFTGTTTVRGGVGTDTLTVTTTGTTNPFVTTAADPAGGRIGNFAFGNRGPVNFAQTETFAAPANFVTVTKTDGLTRVLTGSSINYTVTVTNNSSLGVNGISVTDLLPAVMTGVTWTAVFTPGSTGTTAGSGNITQVVNLAAGGSVTYTVTGTIDPAFSGTLTNTATAAVPAGLIDNTAADDTATDTTLVTVDLFAVATGPGVPVQVNVFNANGTLRHTLSPFVGFAGGASVATGDVTGDGVDDIAVGALAGGGPHVKVFDGATGTELRSIFAYADAFRGGVSVGLGDVTGDGRADIVTGAGRGGGPHVKVFDGVTGAEVRSFFAYAEAFAGGVSVAAGDVTGDGRADVITGAGTGGGPHVKAFDGATGQERLSFFAYAEAFAGGVNVAAGDLDGDGRDEILTGAGRGGGPHVKAFDGVTGAERLSLFTFDPAFLGGVNVAANDRDADGRDDLVLGAGPGGGPHVRILSPAGGELASFFAFDPAFLGGAFVG